MIYIVNFFKRLFSFKYEIIVLALLCCLSLFVARERYALFDQAGGDFYAYAGAAAAILDGNNFYFYTIASYGPTPPGDHGHANLPGLIYIYAPLLATAEATDIPVTRLWKIPILLADLGVGFLVVYLFYKKIGFKKILPIIMLFTGLIVWFFNPYMLVKGTYTHNDALPIFFMLLSFVLLEKDKSALSGASIMVAISFKTFPILVFPLLFFRAKDKVAFLGGVFTVFLLISLYFMRSIEDFKAYIVGSFFVHGNRGLSGRPLLSYLEIKTGINFFQVQYFQYYVYLAMAVAWLFQVLAAVKTRLSPYLIGLVSFVMFYAITPVLQRTYLIWFIPLLLVGALGASKKRKLLYFVLVLGFYLFYEWYLFQWIRGFRFYFEQVTY